MNIQHNYPLLAHNTFGMDVEASVFVEYESVTELKEILLHQLCPEGKWLHIGGGSNLLFTGDFDGMILHSAIKGFEVVSENEDEVLVRAGAGEVWDDFVAYAVEKGWLEPVHAGAHTMNKNDWTVGVINDDWVEELNYIALREITLGYNLPSKLASKVGAQNVNISATARNLCYLYNSLTNNLNPESVRGNASGEFRIRSFNPYSANFMFTLNVNF